MAFRTHAHRTPLKTPVAYGGLAKELIFLCRFFAQAQERSLISSFQLRK